MSKLLQRADLKRAHQLFVIACKHAREHSRVTADALKEYGDHGPQISGCIREHFPDAIKDRLRNLARTVTRVSDMAYAARPPRVRMETMRQLSRAVARKCGSGFYGPQP
jgi:hypothetical protein